MAELIAGQTLTTTEAVLPVENLSEGRHVFELKVEDEAGNLSQPARVVVVVRGPAPRITSFDPVFGRPKTRVVLRVTGLVSDDFAGDHEVEFNGVPAPVVGGSTTTLHALVPEAAATGPITVITRNGRGDSADPFLVPESRFLSLAGQVAPCFGPDGSLLATIDQEGVRLAIWNLKDTTGNQDRPAFQVLLRDRATRLLWIATREISGFFAWDPGAATANLVVPGELTSLRLKLPGAAVEIEAPVAGRGEGAAGIFTTAAGGPRVAVMREDVKTWSALDLPASRTLSLSHDGRRLAVAALDAMLFRLDLPQGALVEKIPAGTGEEVERVLIGDTGGIWALSAGLSRALLAEGNRVLALDLGLRAESTALAAAGDPLLGAGGGRNALLAVGETAPGRLSSGAIKLPFNVVSPYALALSPDGKHAAVLHHRENAVSFIGGRDPGQVLTIPLGFFGGSAFTGNGKLPTAATTPDGRWFAFATEEGIVLLQSASVLG